MTKCPRKLEQWLYGLEGGHILNGSEIHAFMQKVTNASEASVYTEGDVTVKSMLIFNRDGSTCPSGSCMGSV